VLPLTQLAAALANWSGSHAGTRQDRRTGFPRFESKRQPSNRWRRANATRNRANHRTTHLRRDAIHQLTTSPAAEYGTIVVEGLHVAGMVRHRRLARSVADAGFGEIRHRLAYKTNWNGGHLEV
jgi:IS605 OrfB family transposase